MSSIHMRIGIRIAHLRLIWFWLAALLLLLLVGIYAIPRHTKAPVPSPLTTYITGPLTTEGYVDYLAYLNSEASKGCDASSNFELELRKELGFSGFSEDRQKYLALLGVSEISENHPHFVSFETFAKMQYGERDWSDPKFRSKVMDDFYTCTTKPWDSRDFQQIFKWITQIDQSLDRIVKSTVSACWYTPYIASSDMESSGVPTFDMRGPNTNERRSVVYALTARAMLRCNSRDLLLAEADVDAAHRIAMLAAQGFTPHEVRFGFGFEVRASQCRLQLLFESRRSETSLRRAIDAMRSPFDSDSALHRVVLFSRLVALDTASRLLCNPKSVQGNLSKMSAYVVSARPDRSPSTVDLCLKSINRHYDNLSCALSAGKTDSASSQYADIEKEIVSLAEQPRTSDFISELVYQIRHNGRGQLSDIISSKVLLATCFDLDACRKLRDSCEAWRRICVICYTIELYNCVHHRYPKSLDDILADLEKSECVDPFTGSQFEYLRGQDGYTIFSPGLSTRGDRLTSVDVVPVDYRGIKSPRDRSSRGNIVVDISFSK